MARKYTKVEHLISIIEERAKAGETYREIGASLGLTREEVRGAMHRHMPKNESCQRDTSRVPRDVHARNQPVRKQNSAMNS